MGMSQNMKYLKEVAPAAADAMVTWNLGEEYSTRSMW